MTPTHLPPRLRGRRRWLIAPCAAMIAASVSGCSGSSSSTNPSTAPSSTTGRSTTTVPIVVTTETTLPPHVQTSLVVMDPTPYWPQRFVAEPQPVVDAQANVYLETADERDAAQFLMGWAPAIDIDSVLGGDAGVDRDGAAVAYTGGYWHGVWMRSLVDASGQRNAAMRGNTPITRATFNRRIVGTARNAAAARALRGDALINALDAMLWRPAGVGSSEPVGLVEQYGYERGALRALFDHPATGATALDDYTFTCAQGLQCDFTNAKLNSLPEIDQRFGQPFRTELRFAGLRRRVDAVEAQWATAGARRWTSQLHAAKFPDPDYTRLLDVQSSRLEAVLAATQLALEAVVRRDPTLARSALRAIERLDLWAVASELGANEGRTYRPATFASR